MRTLLCCALVTVAGCGVSKGNCVEGQYYVGPTVGARIIGTNGENMVVVWHRSEEVAGDLQSTYQGALFDQSGSRSGEFSVDYPYTPDSITGAPDRALVTGVIEDFQKARSFYAIQLATGEVLAPTEPPFLVHGGVFEGTSFLVASEHGVARLTLDGVITDDIDLGHSVGAVVGGSTVTWAISTDNGHVTGVRIVRGGGALDTVPHAIADTRAPAVTAARGDEVVFAALDGLMLTWSVLGANGSVTTSISTTTVPTSADAIWPASASALVAEGSGYLMFVQTDEPNEIGFIRIAPEGEASPYVRLADGAGAHAISQGGRSIVVYSRIAEPTSPPAVDAIVVADGGPPNAPITLEKATGGHTEERTCHWYE